jgi:hypothetical protein
MSKRYALETIAAAKQVHLQGGSFREAAAEVHKLTGIERGRHRAYDYPGLNGGTAKCTAPPLTS